VVVIGVADLSSLCGGASGVDLEGKIERKETNNEAPQKPRAKPLLTPD